MRKDGCIKQVPLLFVIMSGRKKLNYRKVKQSISDLFYVLPYFHIMTGSYLSVIIKVLEILPSSPALKKIVIDFEAALWTILRELLPNVKLSGCVFHWTQALWRKVSWEYYKC